VEVVDAALACLELHVLAHALAVDAGGPEEAADPATPIVCRERVLSTGFHTNRSKSRRGGTLKSAA
jgi:hypothetical protein